MRFDIMTLFPEMVMNGLETSIIGRAVKNKILEIEAWNIRDYAFNKHSSVDDYPYGGGAGMLMQAEPVYQTYLAIREKATLPEGKRPRVIYLSPQGKPFNQKMAEDFAKEDELVLLCGHYEGIDERVLEEIVTDYVSAGDYVLTGGELPAMMIVDAVSPFCLPVFFETAARGFSRRHGERNGLIPAAAGKFDFFSVGNCAEINKMI